MSFLGKNYCKLSERDFKNYANQHAEPQIDSKLIKLLV